MLLMAALVALVMCAVYWATRSHYEVVRVADMIFVRVDTTTGRMEAFTIVREGEERAPQFKIIPLTP